MDEELQAGIMEYLPFIRSYLKNPNLEAKETPYGFVVVKGNWKPSKGVDFSTIHGKRGLRRDITKGVVHERVVGIRRHVPIRSHEELLEEVVVNVGGCQISQEFPNHSVLTLEPGKSLITYPLDGTDLEDLDKNGFYHGWSVQGMWGVFHVVKLLHPSFVQGNSFRMPENTYEATKQD